MKQGEPAAAAMKVLVTGATGLVGRATVERLSNEGHEVWAASRKPAVDWNGLAQHVQYTPGRALPAGMDAIINLAGASIGGKRWNNRYKQELVNSRLQITRDVVAAQPSKLVQASAIGFYGINPEGTCTEEREPGTDFLAGLCKRWEAEAAGYNGPRAVFRFAHVLDDGSDGILARLLPLYKARLGGRIGSGKQGMPWVHVEDVARVLVWAATSDVVGTYNLAAPDHVNQATWNKALAKALNVCAPWWIPGPAMRVAVGGLGPYLVGGQHTPPNALEAAGFQFKHPNLSEALGDLLGKGH